jgi:hypothetical protein
MTVGALRIEQLAKRLAPAIALAVACVLLTAGFARAQWQGLYLMDALDSAQVAREISDGHGFTTRFVRPVSLQFQDRLTLQPDLYQEPIYPLALALFFGVLPQTDRTVAIAGIAFHLLTLLMIFLLARRLFDQRVAALAVLAYAANSVVLGFVISGLHVTLSVLLLTAVLYVSLPAARSEQQGAARTAGVGASAAAGALFGLAYLTDYSLLPLLLPLAVFIALTRSPRWRHVGVLLGAFALVGLPWFVRNWVVAGKPFLTVKTYWLAAFTDTYPGLSIFRDARPVPAGPLAFALGHPAEVARKWLLGLGALYSSVPMTAGLYLVPFFLAGLLAPIDGRSARLLRQSVVFMAALLLATVPLHNPQAHFFLPLIPAITIFAAASFWQLVSAQERTLAVQTALAAGLVAVIAYPLFTQLALMPKASQRAPGQAVEYVGDHLREGAVVMTDVPWEVAWYARRTAVWLTTAPRSDGADPTQTPDFARVDGPQGRVDAILLSASLRTYPANERVAGWQRIRDVPAGFEPAAAFARPDGGREVLLVRRGRDVVEASEHQELLPTPLDTSGDKR